MQLSAPWCLQEGTATGSTPINNARGGNEDGDGIQPGGCLVQMQDMSRVKQNTMCACGPPSATLDCRRHGTELVPAPAGELSALSLMHASNSSNKVGEGCPGADYHPIISASLLWRRPVYPAGCHHPGHTQDCLKASGTIGYDLTLSLVCTRSWRVAS